MPQTQETRRLRGQRDRVSGIEAAGWQLRPNQRPKARPVSTLKLVELRNDDGHLVGWIPFAEAAAAALLRLSGGAP